MTGQFSAGLQDWSRSLRLHALWINLAMEDLRDRYRRTLLGLSWILVSFALFVAVKVFVFGQLTKVSAAEFGIFCTLGFGLWTYINAMVVDACNAYMHARPWILGTSTPYPVFLLQAVFRNWVAFALILVVMAASLLWKTTPWTWTCLTAVPALLVYLVSSLWFAAILAPLCARYRDLFHTVQTSLRLIFFATPILWMPSTSGRLATLAHLNPIAHFVAIVREPLMYNRVPDESWVIVLAINAVGLVAGAVVYARTRSRVAHWV